MLSQQLAKLPANAKVGVVGGGISGLTFAYFLNKLRPDVKITLFEAQNRTSGWLNSFNTTGPDGKPVMIEKGPRTLRGVSDGTLLAVDTLRDLGKSDVVQYVSADCAANRKFLLDPNDKLVQMPNAILSKYTWDLVVNPLGKGLIKGILGEWSRKSYAQTDKDESVHSLISRRFGNEYVSNNLLSAIYHGIYAGDIKKISAKKTNPLLFQVEKKFGSLTKQFIHNLFQKKPPKATSLNPILSSYQKALGKDEKDLLHLSQTLKKFPMLGLKGGLETFPLALKEALLKTTNVDILTGKEITDLEIPNSAKITVKLGNGEKVTGLDHVRLSISPPKMATLVQDKNLKKDLERVEAVTTLLVNFYLPNKDVIPSKYQGFGYLVPQSNPNQDKILGVILDSVIEKNYQPLFAKANATTKPNNYTKLTVMIGGHMIDRDLNGVIPGEEDTISRARRALHRHLGISEADLDAGLWQYTPATKGLPQFFVGYPEWQDKVENEFLTNYRGKVSIGGMGFSKGPGVPDVIMDSFQDAIKITSSN